MKEKDSEEKQEEHHGEATTPSEQSTTDVEEAAIPFASAQEEQNEKAHDKSHPHAESTAKRSLDSSDALEKAQARRAQEPPHSRSSSSQEQEVVEESAIQPGAVAIRGLDRSSDSNHSTGDLEEGQTMEESSLQQDAGSMPVVIQATAVQEVFATEVTPEGAGLFIEHVEVDGDHNEEAPTSSSLSKRHRSLELEEGSEVSNSQPPRYQYALVATAFAIGFIIIVFAFTRGLVASDKQDPDNTTCQNVYYAQLHDMQSLFSWALVQYAVLTLMMMIQVRQGIEICTQRYCVEIPTEGNHRPHPFYYFSLMCGNILALAASIVIRILLGRNNLDTPLDPIKEACQNTNDLPDIYWRPYQAVITLMLTLMVIPIGSRLEDSFPSRQRQGRKLQLKPFWIAFWTWLTVGLEWFFYVASSIFTFAIINVDIHDLRAWDPTT